ncbi:uncharacterized protein BCR38DRAFT_207713 [Pseudomassariella vexata]|uniref:Uncharacterized protein n=1 Tax=Pseudomassariella vexata TaxID=1141098 RepID=A0A1Y2DYG1_9PEZI|nr:uncharacterized protein BCR38DRAFT_207713 [Pseudomassariella vexata]ORY64124.1 hypothetical protein BCR38DRAFT_207713 [Pseudomassariella vexata]
MRPLKKKGKGEPPAVGFRNIKTREEEEQNGELFTADGDSRATRSNGNNFNPQDVPGCLKTCRKFFFEDFVAVDNPEKGAASKENCEVLRDGYESTTLWALYACDAFQCGVYIDLEGPLGQSREYDHLAGRRGRR